MMNPAPVPSGQCFLHGGFGDDLLLLDDGRWVFGTLGKSGNRARSWRTLAYLTQECNPDEFVSVPVERVQLVRLYVRGGGYQQMTAAQLIERLEKQRG